MNSDKWIPSPINLQDELKHFYSVFLVCLFLPRAWRALYRLVTLLSFHTGLPLPILNREQNSFYQINIAAVVYFTEHLKIKECIKLIAKWKSIITPCGLLYYYYYAFIISSLHHGSLVHTFFVFLMDHFLLYIFFISGLSQLTKL